MSLTVSEINRLYTQTEFGTQRKNGTKISVKPFVKWVGGKGQLLPHIRGAYPKDLGVTVTKYAEPFVGGGAVFFDVLSRFELEEVYISDINAELINTYTVIRDTCDSLLDLLSEMEDAYLPQSPESRKELFYEKRDRYNYLKSHGLRGTNGYASSKSVEMAALFIFLNKTCFNGLYRVNKMGLFNVPSGSYKKPTICDERNLKNTSAVLHSVTIACCDYMLSENFVDENTFVYFDPPYRPITITSNFTSYTAAEFDDGAHIQLAEYAYRLDKKHAKILMSNSDPKNNDPLDNFFDNLYTGMHIRRVAANRMINCNGESRGEIRELLISNYSEDSYE
ncbi:MAG: DNA adenine methylase [Methanocalculaceae archaeon]|nr:DNA adenine methylase [Methanocalculaceae archaeon]